MQHLDIASLSLRRYFTRFARSVRYIGCSCSPIQRVKYIRRTPLPARKYMLAEKVLADIFRPQMMFIRFHTLLLL